MFTENVNCLTKRLLNVDAREYMGSYNNNNNYNNRKKY